MDIATATAHLTGQDERFAIDEIPIRGITTRVWRRAFPHLRALLESSRRHGSETYLVYEDERVSYEAHHAMAATLARALIERCGVTKGDRVAIAMRNLPEWVVSFWAAAAAGAIIVPINAWGQPEELVYALGDCGAKVVVADAERARRLRPHLGELPDLGHLLVTHEDRTQPEADLVGSVTITPFADLVPWGPLLGDAEAPSPATWDATLPAVELDPEDDATIFYTSGTTGRPKGAVGTHRNICTNLTSLFFVNARTRLVAQPEGAPGSEGEGDDESSADPSAPQRSNLLSVPLFHATGCHSVLITNTAAGGKLVMMHHWNAERALELIERERITTFGGVPAMVMQVLDSPDFDRRDTSSIRGISYGGAPAPPDLVRRLEEHFPVGSPSNGWGLTETSSVTAINSGPDYVRKPDSVGPPVPVCRVAVVPDDFTGEEPGEAQCAPGSPLGELWVQGPNVVRGYWGNPDATAASFHRGWLRTGDIGFLDEEGFVHIVDRAKDMVIRGGENVYCVEVEDVLFSHPAVSDCAVVGIPHPILGEEVGAAVVLRPGAKVTADDLRRHVAEHLASFKVPTHLYFRSAPLPRSPQGKVLKRDLKTELLSPPPVEPRTEPG